MLQVFQNLQFQKKKNSKEISKKTKEKILR